MFKEYLKLIRVVQWIKNIFVFIPLIFSKHLFESTYFLEAFLGFIAFCFASSAVYIVNDLFDLEADRKHPVKKKRPIASGRISKSKAKTILFALLVLNVLLLSFLPVYFGIITAVYFFLNLAYTTKLKKVVLLDIFSIAAGFMLRVAGGGYVIDVPISSWLILTTMFLSLLLAVLKRRSELELTESPDKGGVRKVLGDYSLVFLDQMATVASSGVVIFYALYTVSPRTIEIFGTENLIYTSPFILFGVFRYMFLVMRDKSGEYTTEIILKDVAMVLNAIIYAIFIILIVYYKF
ncbi:MAG TPA: decaprenyl-phosphate phosphoribosyltransferase [Ignavibacteriaceae bacterium]|nr:decaprenyl-phosphate phosphoribosyltransferase [Ignavibacteriaceae bacterium]